MFDLPQQLLVVLLVILGIFQPHFAKPISWIPIFLFLDDLPQPPNLLIQRLDVHPVTLHHTLLLGYFRLRLGKLLLELLIFGGQLRNGEPMHGVFLL